MLSILFEFVNSQPSNPFEPESGHHIRQYLLTVFEEIQEYLVPDVSLVITLHEI